MQYADRKNQHLGYFGLEHKCKRKNNYLAFKMMEFFGLDNAWIVWKEARGRLGDDVSKQHEKYGSRVCRGKLFRKWVKECVLRNPRRPSPIKLDDGDITIVNHDYF